MNNKDGANQLWDRKHMNAAEKSVKKQEKDEVFWKILNGAIELDIKKGHLKWTLSDLSRKSQVTRSLIYYYFGRSKIDILKEAVRIVGEEFVGLSEDRMLMWQQGDLAASMVKTRQLSAKTPHLSIFILEHRDQNSEIGEELRKIEKAFLEKLETFFPHLNESSIKALFAFYWGLTFAPLLDEKSIQVAVQIIKSIMLKAKNQSSLQ